MTLADAVDLPPELAQLRATVERFARQEIAPVIAGYYEREAFPYPIVAKMGDLGLFGLPFPEHYGGMGGDYLALAVALEELARVDSSVAITLEAAVGLGTMPIYCFGSEEQKQNSQIFGGYGFMNDTPAGRFYRDAKILEIGEGTSEVQRMLIARDLGLPAGM